MNDYQLPPQPIFQSLDSIIDPGIVQVGRPPSFSTESIKSAQVLANLKPEIQREVYQLFLHPEFLPNNSLPQDPWQPFTLRDAFRERPEINYVVDGLFVLPSLSIVYGAPGTLKSFVLADLAVCVASGKPWLPEATWNPGAVPIKTIQSPVMWIDFDNGANRTHERFESLARARNLPEDISLSYYSLPSPWLDASKADSVGMLILRAQALGARLIIVDNLGNVSGGAEENSSAMIQVMGNLRELCEATGAAVIVIHHQRKGNGFSTRAGESLRGHSSIEAALDLALLVEREEGSEIISIRGTKSRGVDVLPFGATFAYSYKNNGGLDTSQFFGLAIEDSASQKAVEREILSALGDQPLNQSELVKSVKAILSTVGRDRIINCIKQLERSKRVQVQIGLNNSRKYSL